MAGGRKEAEGFCLRIGKAPQGLELGGCSQALVARVRDTGRSMSTEAAPAAAPAGAKGKKIYTYSAPWTIYGMNWSERADQPFRLAIGSFEEEYCNSVRIVQMDEETRKIEDVCSFEHPYPTTRIKWIPDPSGARRDLLATTGDYLRIWQIQDNKAARLECLLNNVGRAPGTLCMCPDPVSPAHLQPVALTE